MHVVLLALDIGIHDCIFTEKTCNLSTLKEMIPSLERKKSLTNLSQVLIVVSVKNLHLVGWFFANNFCQIDQSQYYIIMKSQKLNFFHPWLTTVLLHAVVHTGSSSGFLPFFFRLFNNSNLHLYVSILLVMV